MPSITLNNLVAKNKAGTGIRNNDNGNNRQNNAAVKKLVELLNKVAPIVGEDNEALQLSVDVYGKALDTLANNPVTRNTQPSIKNALKTLDGFSDSLTYIDVVTKMTGYQNIVKALPAAGSSKAEFDALLRTVNGVLELGLEKSVLKPVDPREAERQRQEQERQRREAELRRQEQERLRQEQERQRQEQERLRQAEEARRREVERQRQEEERARQEELRRQREAERRQQEQERLRREQEQQRRQQRVQEIRDQKEAFLKENYRETDYAKDDVAPLKIENDYQQKVDAMDEAERVAANDNILDHQRQEVIDHAEELLSARSRRKQEREEAELLAEDDAKKEKPLVQTTAVLVSQDLKDSFLKRFPDSDKLTARDNDGNVITGTHDILEALSDENAKTRLYIDIPDDPNSRCMCLQGEDGKLLMSNGPVQHGDPDIELEYADPEPTLETEFLSFYAENGITEAVGMDGTVYKTKEDMYRALDEEERLMLFGENREFAVAVSKQNDALYATEKSYQEQMGDECVSPDRIPEKTTLFGVRDDDILYAVTDDGTRLDSPEAIRNEIKTGEGRLRIHTEQDRENPYVLDYRTGHAAITKFTVNESYIAKLTDNDFKTCLPEEIEEKRILNWTEKEIDYAVDADGKRYNTPEEIKTALYGADKTLQLYTKETGREDIVEEVDEEGNYVEKVVKQDHSKPFVVEKRNNRFFISPERVTPFKDQMRELGTRLSEMDREDFSKVNVPTNAKEFMAKNFTDSTDHRASYAVDDKGNLYEGSEKIAAELDKSDKRTLYVFDETGELPYAVRKEGEKYFISSQRIGTQNIMPETDRFQPKKSLKPDELGNRMDATMYWDYKTQKDRIGELKGTYTKEIERLTKLRNDGEPKKPQQPVRPRLGAWNTFVRGLKKAVTLGFGAETQAYKAYTARKVQYQKDMESLPERQAKYEALKKEYDSSDVKLAEAQAGVEKAEKRLGELNEKYRGHTGGVTANEADNSMRDVVQYRNRTEAKLEGVLDLKIKGRITQENIFAHTWLKEAECRGKSASDPNARKALCEFIAADAVQNDILDSRFKGTDQKEKAKTSDALDERSINPLNTGKAADALMKDQDLKKLLDSMKDEPIDPQRIKSKYMELVADRSKQANREINVYTSAKETMEREFGQQELSEKALDEVLRYKKLDEVIRNEYKKTYGNAGEGLAAIFGMKPTEADKQPYREAFNALKEQGAGPMGLNEMMTSLNAKKAELQAQHGPDGPQL